MRIRGLLVLGAMACGLAQAGAIEVDFVGAEIPTGPGSTVTIPAALPGLMGGASDAGVPGFVGDTLFLKFKIPDISEVASINSFSVSVSVFDNGDGGGESADIAFAQPSTNISLASPAFTTLNHVTAALPTTFTYNLTPDQIAQVLPTITDGNFRVRIMRDTGDFEVAGGSASIDATLAPEPSSMMLLTGGFLVAAGLFRRIRK
jgi:PEP-CTERM motif